MQSFIHGHTRGVGLIIKLKKPQGFDTRASLCYVALLIFWVNGMNVVAQVHQILSQVIEFLWLLRVWLHASASDRVSMRLWLFTRWGSINGKSLSLSQNRRIIEASGTVGIRGGPTTYVPSTFDCANLCDAEQTCLSYQYNVDTGVCLLYEEDVCDTNEPLLNKNSDTNFLFVKFLICFGLLQDRRAICRCVKAIVIVAVLITAFVSPGQADRLPP